MEAALAKLEELTIVEIRKAYSQWRLVDMLSQTRLTDKTLQAVQETMEERGWATSEVEDKLMKSMGVLENRNRKIASRWLNALS